MSGLSEIEVQSNQGIEARSLIHSIVGHSAQSVIIQGPYASSLAMNAAYAVAKQFLGDDAAKGFCPVTYLVRRNNDFPLICTEVWSHDQNLEEKKQIVDLELSNQKWDEKVLQMIDVVHVRSIRELLSFLLSLHSNQRRPTGALIIDSIEHFLMKMSENSTFTSEATQKIIQICKKHQIFR
jgi:hypothetical protein